MQGLPSVTPTGSEQTGTIYMYVFVLHFVLQIINIFILIFDMHM